MSLSLLSSLLLSVRWNETDSSSPAVAMRAAKSLYDTVSTLIKERERTIGQENQINTEQRHVKSTTKVEDLQTLFETRLDFLKQDAISTPTLASPLANNIDNKRERLHYVYSSAFNPECEFTNWNNDFKGTLDYIFHSDDIEVKRSQLISSRDDLIKRSTRARRLASLETSETSKECTSRDDEDDYGKEATLRNGPYPSRDWPSDHLMLLTNITNIS